MLSPVFLLDHLPVLAVGAAVVIASKTLLVGGGWASCGHAVRVSLFGRVGWSSPLGLLWHQKPPDPPPCRLRWL